MGNQIQTNKLNTTHFRNKMNNQLFASALIAMVA